MCSLIQSAPHEWELPIPLTLATLVVTAVYLRGWSRLRATRLGIISAWRANSFLLGLFLVWAAIGSPLAVFDEDWLTVHMIQHLLLMTVAPPLILLGAPVMPLLHGLPRDFVRTIVGPMLRWPAVQCLGTALSQPAVCWLAAAAALIGWHIPAAFNLGLQSETWHAVEHMCFLGSGLLFWWPVVQPWPSVAKWPRWSILLYLFAATLPCDVLSGFLVFCERIVYPAYISTSRSASSVLSDQQCAGALMWTCVTVIYLVAGTIFATKLLTERQPREEESPLCDLLAVRGQERDPRSAEVA
jgi:putative membrane protein